MNKWQDEYGCIHTILIVYVFVILSKQVNKQQ